MTKAVYLRLALRNLARGTQTWRPFLLAASLLTFALYAFCTMVFNPGLQSMPGGESFSVVLVLGLIVVGLFTAIFLLYANAFLIRRRKKELGLYGILGMEQRHVRRVIFHELALAYLFTIAAGLGLGTLLARLLFLVLRALMRNDAMPLSDTVNPSAMGIVALIMGVLFLVMFLFNALQVRLAKPIDLLRSDRQGEREPRARWLLAIIGLAAMLAGYWIAAQVNDPVSAIALFFLAVLLVILGTYLLFLAGSIAVLKLLKGCKRFYYHPKHFATVGGLLHRMKQNATGLASIAILCTMAMVTIGITGALYVGAQRMLDAMYLSDIEFEVSSEKQATAVLKAALAFEQEKGVTPENRHFYRIRQEFLCVRDDTITTVDRDEVDTIGYYDHVYASDIMLLDEYNALEGTSIVLGEKEAGWFGKASASTMAMGDETWHLQPLPKPSIPLSGNMGGYRQGVLVVKDLETIERIAKLYASSTQINYSSSLMLYMLRWDLPKNLPNRSEIADAYIIACRDAAKESSESFSYTNKPGAQEDWYAMYGSFLFVGVFCGLIFMMGTALIIYFKQVSEGYQDHDRYIIMQKVGMSQSAVRHTVRRQILLVFFLPLAVALCHVMGSLHMVTLMLSIFGLTDVPFIASCTVVSAAAVAGLYLLFYQKTASTYFKLVRFDDSGKA